MITKKEMEQLLDDLKIVVRLHKIVRDEDNAEKRHYASLIVEDMMSRFLSDVNSLTTENKNV